MFKLLIACIIQRAFGHRTRNNRNEIEARLERNEATRDCLTTRFLVCGESPVSERHALMPAGKPPIHAIGSHQQWHLLRLRGGDEAGVVITNSRVLVKGGNNSNNDQQPTASPSRNKTSTETTQDKMKTYSTYLWCRENVLETLGGRG